MSDIIDNYAKLFVDIIYLHYEGGDLVDFFNEINVTLIDRIKELELDILKETS